MEREPLFFEPVFKERIWGGQKLKTAFEYNIDSEYVGECWAISAHENGESVVKNGVYKGRTLSQLWKDKRELFGNIQGEKFPLLVKILDANDDLSVQVHPNDTYALEKENGELGKTECWYILDCEEDAELIYGHNAKTKAELEEMIHNGEWNTLLRKVKIKKGDFFYVPSGTIHALCKGTLVLEVQQSSDTTYRLYDYERKDSHGRLRQLHLQQSIEVSTVPFKAESVTAVMERLDTNKITKMIDSEYFNVSKLEITESYKGFQSEPFCLYSVIDGEGYLEKDGQYYPLRKGTHFLLPNQFGTYTISGSLTCIVAGV